MSKIVRTKQQKEDSIKRIVEHARAGRTMTEIVDLEGLDPFNTKEAHNAIKAAGVTISRERTKTLPLGLTKENESWRKRIGYHVDDLRAKHCQLDVSRLLGMTNAEILKATTRPATHNWTLSQLQRLANARQEPLADMVMRAFYPPQNVGFTEKK